VFILQNWTLSYHLTKSNSAKPMNRTHSTDTSKGKSSSGPILSWSIVSWGNTTNKHFEHCKCAHWRNITDTFVGPDKYIL